MSKIIGVNYLLPILDQREVLRPYLYSKMPAFQSNGILTYARIYKNAHQSLKSFFYSLGFNIEYGNAREIKSDEHVIVILRDPLERWISGTAQYFIERVPNLAGQFGKKQSCNITEDIIKLCVDNSIMDLHTELQINFLCGLKFDQCVFFEFNNLQNNLFKFLETILNRKIDVELPFLNPLSNNLKKLEIKSDIENFLNKNANEKRTLIKALDRDYKLIHEVKSNKGFYFS